MKTILLLFILVGPGVIFSQKIIWKLPKHKSPHIPTYFIDGALASQRIINDLNPEDLEAIDLVDSGERNMNKIPDNHYLNGSSKPNEEDVVSQRELNMKYNLQPDTEIYYDGHLVENKSYKIFKKALLEMEIVTPDAINELASPVLNIWTLNKEERFRERRRGCIRITSSKEASVEQ